MPLIVTNQYFTAAMSVYVADVVSSSVGSTFRRARCTGWLFPVIFAGLSHEVNSGLSQHILTRPTKHQASGGKNHRIPTNSQHAVQVLQVPNSLSVPESAGRGRRRREGLQGRRVDWLSRAARVHGGRRRAPRGTNYNRCTRHVVAAVNALDRTQSARVTQSITVMSCTTVM